MKCNWRYRTPNGFDDLLVCEEDGVLTGLWFEGSRKEGDHFEMCGKKQSETCSLIRRWLDGYFAGVAPDWLPPMRLDGATPFRHLVSEEMQRLPFGTVATYGDIAKRIAAKLGKSRMSAQAVGGAVGWNPICILIPCHRVIGAGGKLTGYGGGLKNKIALLKHEGVEL
jgi:methylated-DNA-[protein]-cysteine S-methyltransferase